MKFFKRGFAYNNLAKGFNGLFVMINEFEVKVERNYTNNYSDYEEELFLLAYLCRREILDRMEEYPWSMTSPINIPMMSRGRLTLGFAYQQTIGRINLLAEKLSVKEEVFGILEKHEIYFDLDRAIPNSVKNFLN